MAGRPSHIPRRQVNQLHLSRGRHSTASARASKGLGLRATAQVRKGRRPILPQCKPQRTVPAHPCGAVAREPHAQTPTPHPYHGTTSLRRLPARTLTREFTAPAGSSRSGADGGVRAQTAAPNVTTQPSRPCAPRRAVVQPLGRNTTFSTLRDSARGGRRPYAGVCCARKHRLHALHRPRGARSQRKLSYATDSARRPPMRVG